MATLFELKVEIGEEAFNELSDDEKDYALEQNDEVSICALKAFEILMKKFRPAYKMGKFYCDDASKFSVYERMYKMYSSQFSAGASVGRETSDLIRWA